jgi:hypothetical protein
MNATISLRAALAKTLVMMYKEAHIGTQLTFEGFLAELLEVPAMDFRRVKRDVARASPSPAATPPTVSTNGHKLLSPGQVQRVLFVNDSQHPPIARLAKKFGTTQRAIEMILARREANTKRTPLKRGFPARAPRLTPTLAERG